MFEDRVESPFKNLSHYADQVDALDDNALDDFVIGEISNRVSSGRTTIGGDSGTRLSKPMLSQTSLETKNLEDSRGLFQPSDGLTLRGFDEISQIGELPENLEKSPFSDSYATHQNFSNKIVVTSKTTNRLKKRASMPGLTLQSMNKLKKMEERQRVLGSGPRLGRELAIKGKLRISQSTGEAVKVTTPENKKKKKKQKKDNPF